MKKLKALLIIFLIILGLSIIGVFSFNNLAPNVNIPENCESCQFNKNDCPLEEVEETQTNDDDWNIDDDIVDDWKANNTLVTDYSYSSYQPKSKSKYPSLSAEDVLGYRIFTSEDFLTENNACIEKLEDICKACREQREPLILSAKAKKQKYYDYGEGSVVVSAVSGLLTLITFVTYLAVKFSVVRTMAAVSLFWLAITIVAALAISHNGTEIMAYILLFNSPSIIFWLYRFISLGPSKMFKDN
jgi:hypothetical protein